MLIIVLVTFVVTWLPSMVFVILRYHHIGKLLYQLYLNFQSKGGNRKHFSSVVNPGLVIYYLTNNLAETA